MTPQIAAVVLAAGLSSRSAPQNKLLAPLAGNRNLIAQTVGNALRCQASSVIVVTGFQAALIGQALSGLPVRFVHADDYAEGLAASLRAGIAALPLETQAALIMLGDMPLVEPDLLDTLLKAYDSRANQDIVVPVWQGQRGNPRVFGRRHFTALQAFEGDAGAKRLLSCYPDRIREIASPDDSVLRDFDTPEALDSLQLR